MSDGEIRALERAAKEKAPGAREKLVAAWGRLGLGWFGEELPAAKKYAMRRASEENVYVWGDSKGKFAAQMVFVPKTYKARCQLCTRVYRGATFAVSGGSDIACPNCDGTKVREVTPFYIGRYPVLVRDMRASGPGSWLWPVPPDSDLHPATYASFQTVKKFCKVTETRLPHGEEWGIAALGTWKWKKPEVRAHKELGFIAEQRARRLQDNMAAKIVFAASSEGVAREGLYVHKRAAAFYPWGPEPPSRERCVSVSMIQGAPEILLPLASVIVEDGVEKSPRPRGRSWCGAFDMVGNVWQYVVDGAAVGGSCCTVPVLKPGGRGDQPYGPELGFRIVVDAA